MLVANEAIFRHEGQVCREKANVLRVGKEKDRKHLVPVDVPATDSTLGRTTPAYPSHMII